MVLMNSAKAARNAASLVNRPNCGGNKKAGTAPTVGFYLSSNVSFRRVNHSNSPICMPNFTVQTQNYGYRATHTGRM